MKKLILSAALVAMLSGSVFARDWKLGVQTWSLRQFTFCESLAQLSDMGVKYVEAYPGQKIGGGVEGTTHFTMSEETRNALKGKLDAAGIKILSYGVVGGKDEAEWRQLFEFAQAMDIEIINSEPNPDHYELLVKLTQEYGVNVGIHNHAKPNNRYWNPQTVLDAVKDRPGLYAAPDNGHWARSGITSVDGFKVLDGQMISIHLKDQKTFNDPGKNICVAFGTGVCDLPAAIKELQRQKYAGQVIIEFESNTDNPGPHIKKCVDWFNANTK